MNERPREGERDRDKKEEKRRKNDHLAHLHNNENNVIKSWSNASTQNLTHRRLTTNLFIEINSFGANTVVHLCLCVRVVRRQLLTDVFVWSNKMYAQYAEIFNKKVRNILTF